MKNDVFSIIRQQYSDMSKGHKRIADYFLDNYQKASFMTAAALGQTVGVSESTVVRFATELGYNGYPDFQEHLREIMKSRLTSVERIEVASRQLADDDICSRIMNMDIDRIRMTIENVDRDAFNGAVNAVTSARKIYITASRSATAVAEFLRYYLNIIFEDVVLIHDLGTSDLLEHLFHVDINDVVIGISFPRYSRQTNVAMKYAAEAGATTIALTDSLSSPIAQSAAYTLTAGSDMVSFADSLVAPLSLINALIVAVSLKKEKEINRNFEKLERLWDEYDVYEKNEK